MPKSAGFGLISAAVDLAQKVFQVAIVPRRPSISEAQHEQYLAAGAPVIDGYLETAERRLAAAYQETHQLLQRYVGVLGLT